MLKDALPETARFVRVMPNTPLAVGEGMSLISSLCTCTDEEFAFTERIFAAAGKVAVVEDMSIRPQTASAAAALHLSMLLSKPWLTEACDTVCRVRWLMNWLLKRLSAQQGWCLKPVNILAN